MKTRKGMLAAVWLLRLTAWKKSLIGRVKP